MSVTHEFETKVEHATRVKGGEMHVRYDSPKIEGAYPLAQWIADHQRTGGKVYRRSIIVLEDWEEVTP